MKLNHKKVENNIHCKIKLNFIMNISELDAKYTINFFNKKTTNDSIESSSVKKSNGLIWTIDNLLLEKECNQIINSCENLGFEYLPYRNSSRLIAYESSSNLTDSIKERLDQDCLLERINKKKLQSKPYGFFSNYITWNGLESNINKCYRINKYEVNQEFKFHRDAQYTQSMNVKSSHTLLIYLNDDFEGGDTIFRIPTKTFINSGYSINKELEVIGNDYIDITIKPEKGMGILFDQRLLHAGTKIISGTKYVLRTDLIRTGIIPENLNEITTEKENQIYKLSKSLFRQAQLLELDNVPAGELYEICIGLRQHPELIETYPAHLEILLTNVLTEDVNMFNNQIKLIERSGPTFKYSYNSLYQPIINILKYCYIASVYFYCDNLNKSLDTKLKILNDKFNFDNINDLVDSGNESKCDESDDDESDDDESNSKYSYDPCSHYNDYTKYERKLIEDIENDDDYYGYGSDAFKKINKQLNVNLKPDKFLIDSLVKHDPYSLLFSITNQKWGRDSAGYCGLCDSSCFNNENDYNAFIKPSVELSIDQNFKMEISDLKIVNNKINGLVEINGIANTFNHASCQCEEIIVFGDADEFYQQVKLNSMFEFDLTNHTLNIEIIPKIIM